MREITALSISVRHALDVGDVPAGRIGASAIRVHTEERQRVGEGLAADDSIDGVALSQGGFAVLGAVTDAPAPEPPLAKITRI